jgi:hydroxyacylglutathione hydrolase
MTSRDLQVIDVALFACLEDNYGLLVRDPASGAVAAIDTPDASRIMAELDARGWRLTHILNTHWHDDHVGGNLALKARYGATVIAPEAERDRIPGVDVGVAGGTVFDFGTLPVTVIATPGHTLGHVVYYFSTAQMLFPGDTLFAMGCGRLFEGTADQMWVNMQMLAALPPETIVYAAHEYTLGNARFAATIEPENPDVAARLATVRDLRARDMPTMPFTIGDERATNPFMRAESPQEMGHRRVAKDNFR